MQSNRYNAENRVNWIKFLRESGWWSYNEMKCFSHYKWSHNAKRQRKDIIRAKAYTLAREFKNLEEKEVEEDDREDFSNESAD